MSLILNILLNFILSKDMFLIKIYLYFIRIDLKQR